MKIRTEADLEKLDLKIKEELGIDVQKYHNEEAVNNFVELLVFPQYVLTWVIQPILAFLLFYILGFFLLDLVHIQYFIYGIVGFFLFLISGTLLGFLFLD